jgi:hypothetical protein
MLHTVFSKKHEIILLKHLIKVAFGGKWDGAKKATDFVHKHFNEILYVSEFT